MDELSSLALVNSRDLATGIIHQGALAQSSCIDAQDESGKVVYTLPVFQAITNRQSSPSSTIVQRGG
jgi:hypothetical protein